MNHLRLVAGYERTEKSLGGEEEVDKLAKAEKRCEERREWNLGECREVGYVSMVAAAL